MGVNNWKPLPRYLKERFPILPAVLYSTTYAALAVGLTYPQAKFGIEVPFLPIKLLLLSAVFFFFLLRARIVDEYKDFEHDLKYYPERPIQRGLVSLKQLAALGIFAFASELALSYLLGRLALYLPVVIYSGFMAKEFFGGDWLKRHFTAYFLSHEMIFAFFAVFFLLSFRDFSEWQLANFIFASLILILFPALVEVIRKFKPRYGKEGVTVEDSYSVVWGRKKTILILASIALSTSFLAVLLKHSFIFVPFGLGAFIILMFSTLRSDNFVYLASATYGLLFTLLVNLL